MKKQIGSKFKQLLVATLTSVMIIGSSLTVFAASAGSNSTISDYLSNNDKYSAGIMASFIESSEANDAKYDDNYEMYTGRNGKYYYIKKDQVEAVEKKIQNKSNSEAAVGNISDITTNLNVGANVGAATTLLSGFMPVLSTVLGLMVVLISLGMTVFSAFDICYIAFPVFRNKCEEHKQTGGALAKQSKTGGGESKLRFVSDDAQYAVQAADTVQSGKNPFIIYFGKRLLSYILLAILLFILLTGRITIFTDLALRAVSGILELIQSI